MSAALCLLLLRVAHAHSEVVADDSLAVFTLVRSLASKQEAERLIATRNCLNLAFAEPVDHLVFHDGHVPFARQRELSSKVAGGLRFVDARTYGGFLRTPGDPGGLDAAALGYRQSERLNRCPLSLVLRPTTPRPPLLAHPFRLWNSEHTPRASHAR
eukprot:5086553-Prymnesium_polylepis.2